MDFIVKTEVKQTNMSDYDLKVIDTFLKQKNMVTHSKNDCAGLNGLNFCNEEINLKG